jgi:predicted short-subunit dehydrogenase-like oxidoreductase (DUF2520 family)
MLRIGLIGPGRAGQALVRLLPPSKYDLGPVLSRTLTSARRVTRQIRLGTPTDNYESFASCDVILVATPDDAIAGVASRLASASFSFRRKVVLHLSGAVESAMLAPVRARGAAVASLHPLQTFGRRVLTLAGVHFGVEGDERALRLAQTLVTDWQGKVIRLRPGNKALYHAAATFASPLFTPLLQAAVVLLGRAGIGPKTALQALRPLLLTTLANFAHAGKQSWTGPFARGDVVTVRKHLEALQRADPTLARYYRSSALAALALLRREPALEKMLSEEKIP